MYKFLSNFKPARLKEYRRDVQKTTTMYKSYIYIYIHIYIQGVPGGIEKTLGECSLC